MVHRFTHSTLKRECNRFVFFFCQHKNVYNNSKSSCIQKKNLPISGPDFVMLAIRIDIINVFTSY